MTSDARAHPVRLVVTDDLQRSRLTVFFRLLLAIPHVIWLGLFTVGAVFVAFINWWATLFMGRSPRGLHEFLAGYVRYATQFFAYLYLAADPYPPFYLGSDQSSYAVDVQIDPPERQNRWTTGFRFFLAIPALMVSGALSGGGSVSSGGRGFSTGGAMGLSSVLNWFSSMVRGRSPRGIRDFSAWAIAYTAQFYAYVFLLTDRYPNVDPLVFLEEAQLVPPEVEGRPQVVSTDDLRRSRLSVFFRLPLAFPHIVWLILWTVVAFLAAIANWFFTLFAGRPARPLARFLSAYIRYSAHVTAFLHADRQPVPRLRRRGRQLPDRHPGRYTRPSEPLDHRLQAHPRLSRAAAQHGVRLDAPRRRGADLVLRPRAGACAVGVAEGGRVLDRIQRAADDLPVRAHRPVSALEPARRHRAAMKRLGCVGAVLVCALALAGQAGATIVINRGIGGVNLGMSQVAVRAKLGRPARVVHGKNEFGPYTEFRYAGYLVDFQDNERVTSIVTTLARERTRAGVGVGSTWSQVRAKVPLVRCTGLPSIGECHVGSLLPGRTVTDFFVTGGRVDRVVVGIVLD